MFCFAAPVAAQVAECDDEYNVSRSGDVWRVSPNGVDDTANLECVLTESGGGATPPTLMLDSGVFHVDWLQVDGFRGSIVGGGVGETSIQPLDGGLDCVTEFAEFGFTIWMGFSDSDLKISHLSIEIPEQACIEPYDIVVETNPAGEVVFEGPFQDFFAMVVVTNRSEEDLAQPCGQSGEGGLYVRNVSAAAPFPDFLAPVFNPKGAFSAFLVSGTPASGCEVFDDLTGTVKVVDSSFTGVGNVLQASAMVDSKFSDAGTRLPRGHDDGEDSPQHHQRFGDRLCRHRAVRSAAPHAAAMKIRAKAGRALFMRREVRHGISRRTAQKGSRRQPGPGSCPGSPPSASRASRGR